jgi:SAM-dependent methyltransferase
MSQVNRYSATWFDLFMRPIQAEQTERELAFIARQLPMPTFATILDLCCGWGRHSRLLAASGYRVTGLDRDAAALEEARRGAAGAVVFLRGDMRNLSELSDSFDGVLCLWQSFGYFDAAGNEAVLGGMAARLRPGGRLILDLYHREYFARRLGRRTLERDGWTITAITDLSGDRLTETLDYGPGGGGDRFDWQLYTPEEIAQRAGRHGLRRLLTCAWYDETRPASAAEARMQLVFEKTGP